jgi:curved DNA-binding protein CbpA
MVTYYDMLGVPPSADHITIKAAYRSRIKHVHPDAGGSAREAVALTDAYRVLADGDARARYDEAIGVAETPTPLGARALRLVLAVALTAGYLASAFH